MERFLESTRSYYPSQGMLGSNPSDFSSMSSMAGMSFGTTFGTSHQSYSGNPFSVSPMFGIYTFVIFLSISITS